MAPGARLVVPRYALTRGHLLVLAEAHLTRFEELPVATWAAMTRLALEGAQAIERARIFARQPHRIGPRVACL